MRSGGGRCRWSEETQNEWSGCPEVELSGRCKKGETGIGRLMVMTQVKVITQNTLLPGRLLLLLLDPPPPSVLPLHQSTPLHSTPLPPNFHSTSLTITLLSLLSINSPLLLTPLPPPLPSSVCPYELSYTELLLKVTKRPHPHTHTEALLVVKYMLSTVREITS